MKRKVVITVLAIGVLYIALSPLFISLFKSEDDRIIDTINTGNMDSLDDVSELVYKRKVDDGIICIAVSNKGLLIVSYLKNERFSDTQYNLLGRVTTEIGNIISNDPLSVTKMPIANFSKYSYYFGFCTSEKAKRLNVDGNVLETEKLSVKIGNKLYSGYFWFYKSDSEPTIQTVD